MLQSDGVALDRPLPAEGFFLAPPPASPRVLFLTLCFLNAAPRLYKEKLDAFEADVAEEKATAMEAAMADDSSDEEGG